MLGAELVPGTSGEAQISLTLGDKRHEVLGGGDGTW